MPKGEKMADSTLVVNGYQFNSAADAAAAREELKKISYIESHINKDDPESVLTIYNKIIANKIFVTPLGYGYLKEVRDFLEGAQGIEKDKIKPLPLNSMYRMGAESVTTTPEPKRRIVPQKKKDALKTQLYISRALNIVLLIAIIAMFVIALNSNNPNILNYENALQDRYAAWEEELNDREEILREKERSIERGYGGSENTGS